MKRCVGSGITTLSQGGHTPQQAFVTLGITEVISTSKRKDTVIETTDQPEFLLLCELALLVTRERVPILGEVFIDLLVHTLLLSRGFWRSSIGFRLGRRDGDIVYGGHDRE